MHASAARTQRGHAKRAGAIYAELGDEKQAIDQAQPWQNYIETVFAVMHLMAD